MTKRTQLTEVEIDEMRNAYLDGTGLRDLANHYRRSITTIAKHTADLRIQPELPPLEVAPDNPNADRWWHRAACRGTDVNTFFPGDDDKAGIEFAQRICAACPVRVPCRQEALDDLRSLGIWAGTTEKQRNGIRSRARKDAA